MSMRAGLLSVMLAILAPAVQAQSLYGCIGLDDRNAWASIEGDGGTFYRLDPDLKMYHALSEVSADRLATLSKALAAQGTTLVYVPLPTKGLAMPDQLPQLAWDYGFDPDMAASVFDEQLNRLRRRGVVTANLRSALRAPEGAPSFFPTDYRLTAAGAKRAAGAIKGAIELTPGYGDMPKGTFVTSDTGPAVLPSPMRAALQRHCQITLPEVLAQGSATDRLQGAVAADGDALFGGPATTSRIVVVGTEHAGEATSNLAGAIAEATGIEAQMYAVPDGGSYAAISSYMTSRAFQEHRPTYLVWINPIENNLARFGDAPMAELTAAAANTCRLPLPVLPAREAGVVSADLTALDRGRTYTLLVEAEGMPVSAARFDFRAADGLVRSRTIVRNKDQVATGRFYMPMTGLWPQGALIVDIRLAPAGTTTARVTACLD